MPKLYERKPDAYREKLSVPVTSATMQALRRLAVARGLKPTTLARDIFENGLKREIEA